jgi:L-alanine-DL-glutamate epimerase-like enolase superfamily enzyme
MARLAVFHGIKVAPHNSTVAIGTMCNTYLFAGMPSGFVCEFFMYPNNPCRDVPFKKPKGPKNGYISLRDRAGFRMELNDPSKRYS